MRRRDDAGQAMVEFALVLPVILLLLFGMTQLALVLNARQTVAYAAEAAANGYAQTLVRATADGDAYAAATELRPRLAGSGRVSYTLIHGATESPITTDGAGVFGDLVAAHVTYDYPSPVRAGLGGFHFPDTVPLTAEAVARIEPTGPSGPSAAPRGPAPPKASAVPRATPSPLSRSSGFRSDHWTREEKEHGG
ncbi:MAG: pilus assembly protein [Chloroflexota bacterium]|nr:pilus assembly protein [Chloroflexota bacterium]